MVFYISPEAFTTQQENIEMFYISFRNPYNIILFALFYIMFYMLEMLVAVLNRSSSLVNSNTFPKDNF